MHASLDKNRQTRHDGCSVCWVAAPLTSRYACLFAFDERAGSINTSSDTSIRNTLMPSRRTMAIRTGYSRTEDGLYSRHGGPQLEPSAAE